MNYEQQSVEPRWRYEQPAPPRFTFDRVIRFLLGIGAAAFTIWVLWFFAGLVVYTLVGLILAYLMKPVVDRLQGLGVGRIPAIMLAFVVFFGALSILLTYLVPAMAGEAAALYQQISREAVMDAAASVERWIGRLIPIQEGVLVGAVARAFATLFQGAWITEIVGVDSVMNFSGSLVDLLGNIFWAVIVIPFVTFFVLKDGAYIRHSVLRLVPNRYFEITLAIIDKIKKNIGVYFRGLLVQCLSVAAVAALLLWIVGLNYALAVAIFTGLANTIPFFGPAMGFLVGALVGIAQTGDLSLVPAVMVAMLLTQLADNLFFQPLIFSRAAHAHPLVILFAVLVGAQLAGIVGMLVAIPLLTTVRVMIEQILWSLRNYRILRTA